MCVEKSMNKVEFHHISVFKIMKLGSKTGLEIDQIDLMHPLTFHYLYK